MGYASIDTGGELAAGTLAERRAIANPVVAKLDWAAGAVSFLSRLSGAIAAAAIITMAAITAYDVFVRYVFDAPTNWSTETSGYLLIVCALFGAVYTMHERGHLAFELVRRRLSSRVQIVLSFGASVLALCYMFVLTWQGLDMTIIAYRQGGGHIGEMNMPQWATYEIIPIGGALFFLELLRQIYLMARASRARASERR